jgi:alkylation response protein AidB-like acyl-CoA dehydrogenase
LCANLALPKEQARTVNTAAAQSELARDAVAYRHWFRRYLRDLDEADRWRSARFSSAESVFEHDAERMRRLYADGWSRFGWPEWAGGLGGTEEHRMAYFDELAHARVPQPLQHQSLEQFLPPLIEQAPDLAAAYLPRYLQGSEWWSTNAAGWPARDDASQLAVSAVPDGPDALILRGPQTWSYVGPRPTQLVLAARTDQSAHNTVITMFLVNADALDSAIRRRAAAVGSHDIVEIAIDHLRVAGARVIAEAGVGVAVLQRISAASHGLRCYAELSKLLFDLTLLREAMATQGSSQGQRQRFAQVYVDVVSAQARSSATIRAAVQAPAQQAPSGDHVEATLLRRARERVSDLILDVGRSRIIRGTTTGGASLASARAEWWYSRAADAVHTGRFHHDVHPHRRSSSKAQVS